MQISVQDLTKRFGPLAVVNGVSFTIEEGELFTLLGPSGCGKTSLLRLIAGFYSPDAGTVSFDGRVVNDVPPHQRGIGMVFQNYALWPHMTVFENVAYGLKLKKVPAAQMAERIAGVLEKVKLSGLGGRYPGQLSGGQQQRVALARALVLNPKILLLDEPLSNLDAKIRVQVRAEIRKLQKELGITAVYVTHDQEEALSLSDRIAVLNEGRVLQVGSPRALYERPANRFVADFIGISNLIDGTVTAVDDERRRLLVHTAIGDFTSLADEDFRPGDRCVLSIRPENGALDGDPAADRNRMQGRVAFVAYLGNAIRYDVEVGQDAVFKVDIRDPRHHEPRALNTAVTVSFPPSSRRCAARITMRLPRLSLAMLGFGLIWTFLIVFILFPLTRIFYDAFTNEAGNLTIANFGEFFTDSFYLRSLWKSLLLGVAAVITTSIIGIAVAFLIVRYEFPYRGLFSYLTMTPMILPPLVGVLGFVFILGRAGTVNILLMDWFGLEHPINFMYGLQGILLVETVHLFPLMTLSILDSLSKIDPSLEEAAQAMGAKGWRRFWTITLPLTTPGYVSGALLVFIWTFAYFITPLVLGVQDLLAPQAYLNIMQFVDRRIFRMGIVISALLVLLAVAFVLAARHYVAIKDYSSLAYSRVERRPLGPVQRWLAVGFLTLLMAVCVIPQVGVLLAAIGRGWALTPFPVHYTLEFFKAVSIETPKFIINSFLYSGLAVVICLAVGVPMAWIMSRTRAPGSGAMDALTTLILAIPGTAIGIAYIRAFNFPLPFTDLSLTSMWIVLPLVLAVRRLPYTVRGSYSSLILVHPSMEEAAANVGATKLRTFRDITVPLVWKGILVGGLFSFIMSIQEASATIFLTLGGWEMIPFGIFTFYIAGSQSQAAALGVILIVVCAVSLYIVNRVAGTRVGGLFG